MAKGLQSRLDLISSDSLKWQKLQMIWLDLLSTHCLNFSHYSLPELLEWTRIKRISCLQETLWSTQNLGILLALLENQLTSKSLMKNSS